MSKKATSKQPTEDRPPFILVDGSSYLYRAFHAMPSLTRSDGQHTGAIYGVVNMLRRLLREYDPHYMAVVFDAPGKTFRDDLYDRYKANRPPMPDDLGSQIPLLLEVVAAMGLPVVQQPGVEADDVIGTLATQAAEQGMATLISTGDKDLAQLVDEHITLVNTMTDTLLDGDGVLEKFGVHASQIVDYLTLIGDSSDNIPGVPKVGPKTAVKWLHEYGSFDEITAHADEIKGKVGENLRGSLKQLPLSRQLVTIRRDVPLSAKPQELQRRPPDTGALVALYRQLEFKSWLSELLQTAAAGTQVTVADSGAVAAQASYETVLTGAALRAWLARLENAALIAIDLETDSLDYIEANIIGVSFTDTAGEAAYVPLAHDYEGAPEQLPRQQVLEVLTPLLQGEIPAKTGHNLKFDMNVLARYDIHLAGVRYDSMLESYVLDSAASRHDLDSLSLKYLGHRTIHFEDVAGKGKQQLTFNQVTLDKAAPYAAEDADVALRLHEALWPRLAAVPALEKVFTDIELPLLPVLSRMERCGVCVDAGMLRQQSRQLAARMQTVQDEVWQLAGEEFNLGSPKQIQAILFDKLGLPVTSKTPKGQPSTAERVLQELALDYPLPALILEHRGLSKLKSTYTDRLPEQINPRTGRVHTSYHQAVAATGRLSSSNPNLQNIPIRSEEGRRIRKAFIAPEGYRLLSADYSQIELRIMAHLSGDAGLLQAFAAGEDVHRATAAEVFGVTPDKVSGDQRRSAKAINFGLIYGMSAFGLARQLGIDRGQAQQYIERYFSRYPGVQRFMDDMRQAARDQGYVETVFGRRLYIPDIRASNAQRRQYAERSAINAPMQGTAADIIKFAMLDIDRYLETTGQDARMIMQVHDELVLEVADNLVDEMVTAITGRMAGVVELKVPLVVDAGVGANWQEAH